MGLDSISHSCRRLLRPRTLHASKRIIGLGSGSNHPPSKNVRFQYTAAGESRLPRIVQPSIWHSVVPKAFRARSDPTSKPAGKRSANPATYFIWIYLLIGSQAIKIISLQNEFSTFVRQADLRLAKLREVVEKLQRGEDVDVEKVLGTGVELEEQEWDAALREIEDEDRIWQQNKQKKKEEQERLAREQQDANPVNPSEDEPGALDGGRSIPTLGGQPTLGFY